MHDRLIKTYRFAVRTGNRPLAERLAGTLGGQPELRSRADRELQRLPRGPARWSSAGERALRRVLERVTSMLL